MNPTSKILSLIELLAIEQHSTGGASEFFVQDIISHTTSIRAEILSAGLFNRADFIAGLKEAIGNKSLREVSLEVDVSIATLSRIINAGTPELLTFARLCKWMKVNPGVYFN